MGGGIDLNFGREETVVANFDDVAVEDDAVKVDVKIVSGVDIAAIVALKAGTDREAITDAAEEGFNQSFLGSGGAEVISLLCFDHAARERVSNRIAAFTCLGVQSYSSAMSVILSPASYRFAIAIVGTPFPAMTGRPKETLGSR